MPNWCDNDLYVIGEIIDVKLFKSENIINNELDFSLKLPKPDGVDWYDWNMHNWGTKWNCKNSVINNIMPDEDDDQKYIIVISFETAWSPPLKWIKYIAEQYPTLAIHNKYSEINCDFSGLFSVKDKDVLCDSYGDYGEYHGYDNFTDTDSEFMTDSE